MPGKMPVCPTIFLGSDHCVAALDSHIQIGNQLKGQIANVQKEAQTERAFLKQRERDMASRNQEFEKEIADVSRRNEQLKAGLEQFARAPVRGEKAPPLPTIPLLIGKARLLMELENNDYANYQLILQTVGELEILRRRTGKVRFG